MVENVESGSLLDNRKGGHYRRPRDEELRQVLDGAFAPHDGDEQVVNEDEAEEERHGLQHRRAERLDATDIYRQ